MKKPIIIPCFFVKASCLTLEIFSAIFLLYFNFLTFSGSLFLYVPG